MKNFMITATTLFSFLCASTGPAISTAWADGAQFFSTATGGNDDYLKEAIAQQEKRVEREKKELAEIEAKLTDAIKQLPIEISQKDTAMWIGIPVGVLTGAYAATGWFAAAVFSGGENSRSILAPGPLLFLGLPTLIAAASFGVVYMQYDDVVELKKVMTNCEAKIKVRKQQLEKETIELNVMKSRMK